MPLEVRPWFPRSAHPSERQPSASPASGYGRLFAWLAIPVLLALVYGPALGNPFVYDDIIAIKDNALIRQLDLTRVFWHGGLTSNGFANGEFRPLTLYTFFLNHAVGGDDPWGYRLVNLVLHGLNALLVLVVLRRLLRAIPLQVGTSLNERQVNTAAWLGACLFAVHPIHSLAVLLVWKRATLFVACFTLAQVALLLRLRGTGSREESPGPHPWLLVGAIVGLQILATLAKEIAIVTPALLLLLDLWPRSGWSPRRARRSLVQLHLPLWGIAGATAVFFLVRVRAPAMVAPLAYLATQVKVVWWYAVLVLAPWLLAPDYGFAVAHARDVAAWLGGVGVVAAAVLTILVRRRLPLLALALLWCALALLPTSSVVPIPFLADEDRVYIASVVLWGCAGAATIALHARLSARAGWMVPAVMAIVLVTACAFTLRRGVLWSDPELLWLDASMRYPSSQRAATNTCAVLAGNAQRRPLALAVCDSVAERFPGDEAVQYNRVRLFGESGAPERARAILAQLGQRGPLSARMESLAGNLAWADDRPAEAIPHYRRALELAPLDFGSALYLARSYAEIGQRESARALSLQLDRWAVPDEPTIKVALAELHRALGDGERACREYGALRPSLARPTPGTDAAVLERACAPYASWQ